MSIDFSPLTGNLFKPYTGRPASNTEWLLVTSSTMAVLAERHTYGKRAAQKRVYVFFQIIHKNHKQKT
jgi:hypothetical protein